MVEEQAASTFFNVGSRGYMMLPGLMAPSEVDSLAQQVDQYIASGGRMLRPYGLGNRGGWYVADFQLALPRVYAALHGRRRLHAERAVEHRRRKADEAAHARIRDLADAGDAH